MLAAMNASSSAAAAAPDINGGSSWNGWTSVGFSNQLGVYTFGTTTEVYEVYKTTFTFDNNSKSGNPVGGGPTGGTTGFGTGTYSAGAFANGNTILGIGVRVVSGGSLVNFTPTIRFDTAGDTYTPASTVGGTDGRGGFGLYSQTGDFTVQFFSSNWAGTVLTLQAGQGTFFGGPSNFQQLGGNIGNDFAFRAFGQANSYQMFFDLTAMQALYGVSNPFGVNPGFTGIAPFANPIRISMNGLGGNNVVFSAATAVAGAVPEPDSWALLIAGFGLVGAAARRQRRHRLA